MKMARCVVFFLALSAIAQHATEEGPKNAGTLVLDGHGFGTVHLPAGFLDTHYCSVGEGWDDISIGFTARYFTVSEGQPQQQIEWACVPTKANYAVGGVTCFRRVRIA